MASDDDGGRCAWARRYDAYAALYDLALAAPARAGDEAGRRHALRYPREMPTTACAAFFVSTAAPATSPARYAGQPPFAL